MSVRAVFGGTASRLLDVIGSELQNRKISQAGRIGVC